VNTSYHCDAFFLDTVHLDYVPCNVVHSAESITPHPRGNATLVAYSGGFVLFGGYMGRKFFNDVHYLVKNKEGLSIGTTTWEWTCPVVSGRLPSPRSAHGACVIGGNMLVYGGAKWGGDASINTHTPLGDCHILNLSTWCWSAVKLRGAVPSPRFGATLTSLADPTSSEDSNSPLALLVGGSSSSTMRYWDADSLKSEVYLINADSHECTLVDFPQGSIEGRFSHSAAFVNGRVIVNGGLDPAAPPSPFQTSVVLNLKGKYSWFHPEYKTHQAPCINKGLHSLEYMPYSLTAFSIFGLHSLKVVTNEDERVTVLSWESVVL
jgi:hypothetical protein